ELKPLLHTWSLGVEEQYYLLFPIFLMFIWKLGKKFGERRPRPFLRHRPHQATESAIPRGDNYPLFGALVLTLLVSFAIAQIGVQKYSVATFYLLPTRAWELAMGALTAFYLFEGRQRLSQLTRQLGASAGLFLIVFATIHYDRYTPFPS